MAQNEPDDKPRQTLSARIDADLVEWLERESAREDRSMSYLINRLLHEAIERREKRK